MSKSKKNGKIGIFGLGLTGTSTFEFLKKTAKEIICWDDSVENRNKFTQEFLIPIADPKWQTLDMIVISPGIAKSHPIFLLANKYNILISSDIQIFLEENRGTNVIIVTGTNGKSTTTALIGHIIKSFGLDYHIGGNIGLPVLALPQNAKGYVIELSSFQLDLLPTIEPTIAILLNITPDHLNRHGTYAEYCRVKAKALDGDGIKIIGVDTKESRELYEKLKNSAEKKLIPISTISIKDGISCNYSTLEDNFYDFTSYNLPELKSLIGNHNHENIAASFAACRAIGLSAKEIITHLQSFKGLAHRMQFIGKLGKISFYNDSKATNTSSAVSSLSTLSNIFWLAGGVFKEENLLLIEKTLKNIKKSYLFGKSKLLFAEYLEGKTEYLICNNMESALEAAINDARQEELEANILLAPACASYDQFKSFEDRGNQFINLCYARLSLK